MRITDKMLPDQPGYFKSQPHNAARRVKLNEYDIFSRWKIALKMFNIAGSKVEAEIAAFQQLRIYSFEEAATSLVFIIENMRVYNLLENLCISQGMSMPKINIIDDDSLNAFASGINRETFTITLSKGIIEKLSDEELEGVMAHELTHIINRDVRLLIVSIIFVGIFAFISPNSH